MELLEVYYTSLGIGGVDAEGLTVTVNQGFVTFLKIRKGKVDIFLHFRVFNETLKARILKSFFCAVY